MSDLNPRVIYSENYNPWFNQALEEHLLNNVKNGEIILYLWQNEKTVIIGRNQNAWRECCCTCLERDGGKLARRLSGGGAVFHDLGNQNFTFITRKENYDLEKQLKVILEAVRNLGVEAKLSRQNDLFYHNLRFSRNAYYFTSERALHHGSILVNTDLKLMRNYLNVSPERIYALKKDSAQEKEINLAEIYPDITVSELCSSLEDSFYNHFGRPRESPEFIDPELREEFSELYRKFASWEWRFGRTPEFDMSFETRFDWGGIELGLELEGGRIKSANIFSDAMNVHLIKELEEALRGCTFNLTAMYNALEDLVEFYGEEDKIMELAEWLLERDL